MDVKEKYESKKITLEEAAKSINNGEKVLTNSVAAMPVTLLNKITDRYQELEDVHIYGSNLITPFKFLDDPEVAEHVHFHTTFLGPLERHYAHLGLFEISSVNFSNIKEYLSEQIKPDVFITTVAPMDDEGYFNLGPMGASIGRLGTELADRAIVQVNPNVPPVNGKDIKIHIDEVDNVFELAEPLAEVPEIPSSDIDKKIAQYLLPEIEDGSTIQIGVGGLSGAVSYGLLEKKNLSVHTEMITESMLTLTEKGAITGKIVGGFAMGLRDLYDFASTSDQISIEPIYEVVNPYIAGQKDKLISINACLMVDLTGQVVSEGVGTKLISSTGGALDFARAAGLSKGGKSFFCLRSTNKDAETGEITSNIRFGLPEGTPVTVPRSDTDYIATEYGVAHLKNHSIQERVHRLIAIAHPDFREELTKQAKKAGYIS